MTVYYGNKVNKMGAQAYGQQPQAPTFQIGDEGRSITCLICGMKSWHPEDVRQLYCGNCHRFHKQ